MSVFKFMPRSYSISARMRVVDKMSRNGFSLKGKFKSIGGEYWAFYKENQTKKAE